jgi:hypothetical protein
MLAPHFVINPVNFSIWQRLNPAEPRIGIVNNILALPAAGRSVMTAYEILIFLIQNLDNLRLINGHTSYFHHNNHAGAAPAQIGMKTGRRKIARFLVKSA